MFSEHHMLNKLLLLKPDRMVDDTSTPSPSSMSYCTRAVMKGLSFWNRSVCVCERERDCCMCVLIICVFDRVCKSDLGTQLNARESFKNTY